ncbi:cyclase family protein [Alphaproteobacteria bacterium]|nr:cyclase family protein [Alphaproteobacteria bacterium]
MRKQPLFILIALLIPVMGHADDWFKSPFGKTDELGAVNYLSKDGVKRAADLVTDGKVYQLGMVSGPNTPAYGPRKFQIIIHQLADGSGNTLGKNLAVSNDDTIITSVGIGSQIDGLGHFGRAHKYYNEFSAADVVAPNGLKKFGTDKLPGIVTRGLVLDMTKHFKKTPVPAGTAYTKEDIKAAEKAQGVKITKGDVVLFHSGYMTATKDIKTLVPGEPGLGVSGAEYLSQLGVVAVGADSWALEVLPSEDPNLAFPVHQILLVKYGVYILENMVTQELVDDGVSEFMFVLGVPKLEGSVQAIINPLAIR